MNFHEDLRLSRKPKKASEKNFGFVMALFFMILALSKPDHRWELLAVAGAFVLLAFLWPKALWGPNWLWNQLALLLSRVTTPLVLGLVFFLVMLPIGFALRVFGKRPLEFGFDENANSYWKDSASGQFKNQF